MIEVGYYYQKGDKWMMCYNHFHNVQKALRFLFMLKKHPKMVYMSLHCDDKYDENYLRRKTRIDEVR